MHSAPKFDELPIPFRAVATDLATGKATVLAEGELAGAIRASMSVPGVFSPAEFDDRQLVDGILTNNLPVDVARAMGADIVIAVNLGSPLLDPQALGSVLGVTEQMVNILTEQNVLASLASLMPTDILIKQSGFRTDALVGESISFGRLVYYKKLVRQTLIEGLYAGFSLEAGEVRKALVPGSPEGLLKSGSLFVALDSFFGPLYLGYGRTTEGFSSFYFFLGKPWTQSV